MSKRTLSALLFGLALAGNGLLPTQKPVFAQSAATPTYSVTVDGRALNFGDTPPVSQNGRVLVPLRAIFEALGATVNFSNGVISAQRGQTNLQLSLGSTQALVNDQTKTLDVAAQAVNGKTLVPLRFIGEALGAGVQFNGATNTIAITSPRVAGGTGTTSPGEGGLGVPSAQTINGTVVRVDGGTPARVVVATGGQLRTFSLAPNALLLRQLSVANSLSETPVRQGARPIQIGELAPGNDVRLTLDNSGNVIQILTSATVILARVQFAGAGQIILDDENDTTIRIGDTVSFTDNTGRDTTNFSLPAGSRVALFLSRETRSIYRVSAAPSDVNLSTAGATTPDPLPGNVGASNAPRLTLVEASAPGPLGVGGVLTVNVRATAGQTVTFVLGSKIQNVTLAEDPQNPGNYSGTYTVRRGDDILGARVTARILGAGGFEATRQSEETVTIDTVPPRLIGTFPAEGARIGVSQPNIAIFADDLGGSGLASATLEVVSGAVRQNVPATVAPPTSVNAVPTQPLSGTVRVNARILDGAGNALNHSFSFSVASAAAGAIQSIAHGATRDVIGGEEIPVELRATPGGGAAFDVRSATGTILARDIPMIEDAEEPGRYTANYRIPDGVTGALRIVGKFTPGDGTFTTSEATTAINVGETAAPARLTITAPAANTVAQNPLVLRGKAAPGALVEVGITALGTQLYVFEYREDLGKLQVRADQNGNWQTAPITLPARRNVSGLTYAISATQTDAADRTSEPVTLTLRGR